MQQITEQQILALAPNPAAGANGKKISQKGGFVRLEKSADDTFFSGGVSGKRKEQLYYNGRFCGAGCTSIPLLLSQQAISL